jgi:hypothetical protein
MGSTPKDGGTKPNPKQGRKPITGLMGVELTFSIFFYLKCQKRKRLMARFQ